jgi:hypothetical protein
MGDLEKRGDNGLVGPAQEGVVSSSPVASISLISTHNSVTLDREEIPEATEGRWRSYKEVFLSLARQSERVKKKKIRRKTANRN